MSPLTKAVKGSKVYLWLREVGRSLSQFINAVLGGYSQESTSSRLGRTRPNCLLCRVLNLLEASHCAKAAEREKPIVDYRKNLGQ